jgi:hypothetical protein
MPNLNELTLVAGVSSDDGTVSTLDALLAVLGDPGPQLAADSTSVIPATDSEPFRVSQDSGSILVANTKVTPKFAKISCSSSGANIVIAAVTSKKIRVLALKITASAAVNVKWQSHTTPTDLSGLSYFAAAGDGEVLPFNPVGWFESLSGESLDANLSGAIAVGGHITYIEV